MQADFILFIRTKLHAEDFEWWPEISLYQVQMTFNYNPFEIFVRAESKQYFEKIKCLFDIQSTDDFKQLLEKYPQNEREMPRGEFFFFKLLLNIEKLATRP